MNLNGKVSLAEYDEFQVAITWLKNNKATNLMIYSNTQIFGKLLRYIWLHKEIIYFEQSGGLFECGC